MKRIKWQLIILGVIIVCLMIVGSVFFPKFTVDKIGFLEPIAYSSFLRRVREPFQPDQNEFLISEAELADSEEQAVTPLDKQEIQRMVKQLIPSDLAAEGKSGKIVLSSANEDIMKDFQEHLHRELPEGWTISRSISDADALVTGDLFILTSPKDESSLNLSSSAEVPGKPPPPVIEGVIENEQEPMNEPLPTEPEIVKTDAAPRRALFLYWIAEITPNTQIVLGATANYENPKIAVASEALARDLTTKIPTDAEAALKVAIINTSEGPSVSHRGTTDTAEEFAAHTEELAKSSLVTASILEKMVNVQTENDTKLNLVFLNKNDTSRYDTELKQALRGNNDQEVSLKNLAEKFRRSTRATAALIISQSSAGHFYLELLELSSLDILAIGRADDQSAKQLQ